MAYKDLLVVLDATPACATRLDVAIGLARRFEAHLTGLHVFTNPYIPPYVAAQIPAEAIEAQRDAQRAQSEKLRVGFEAALSSAGVNGEWRQAEGNVNELAGLNARYADLVVVGQTEPETAGEPGTSDDLPEHLALDAGRPMLVVPYAGKFPEIGKRILLAWNASREAARAVSDAMPFLKAADDVMALSVNPHGGEGEEGHGEVPGADIALHLARHGVKATASHVQTGDVSVGDMLLSRAADDGADLIVMGAYGRSRMRELILGGASRSILGHMTVPVLLSH